VPALKSPSSRAKTDEPIEITSQGAQLTRSGEASLKGKVEVRQGERRISADDIQYDDKTRSLRAQGTVDYRDSQVHISGSSGSYDAKGGAHFSDARFDLAARAARGTAKEIDVQPDGRVKLKGVEYTSCPQGNRDWILKASNITLDTAAHEASAATCVSISRGADSLHAGHFLSRGQRAQVRVLVSGFRSLDSQWNRAGNPLLLQPCA